METATTPTKRSRDLETSKKSFRIYHGKKFISIDNELESLQNKHDSLSRLRKIELIQENRKLSEAYAKQIRRWGDDG